MKSFWYIDEILWSTYFETSGKGSGGGINPYLLLPHPKNVAWLCDTYVKGIWVLTYSLGGENLLSYFF